MVWLPPSGGDNRSVTGGDDMSEVPWMGRKRSSMETNVLIARTELGKPRRSTFPSPEPGHVFGLKLPSDAEGARQVTMTWREHEPNAHAKPPPDFRAMNKMAADSGLTGTRGLRGFRQAHPVAVKSGAAAVHARPAQLPSDKDPAFRFGKPPGYRSAEECRNCGPCDPPMRGLVQGAYTHEWVDMNAARAEELDVRHGYIKPAATKATQGHRLGAQRAAASKAAAAAAGGGWKMAKFLGTPPRVTAYMGGRGAVAPAAAIAEEGSGDDL